jgi:hypothetical protein
VTCPAPAGRCLREHIGPRLADWAESPSKPGQFRARCPAHSDHKPSLALRAGDHARIILQCKAGCSLAAVRAALVLRGVPDGCLPPVQDQRTEDALAGAIIAALDATHEEPPVCRLLAVLAVMFGPQPSRAAAAELAERFGIGRSTFYRVTAMSQSGKNATDALRLADSHSGNAVPILGQNDPPSTSGFGVAVVPGVENSVAPKGLPRPLSVAPVAVTRCAWCESAIEPGRRADAAYCGPLCRQKARRARRRAARGPGGTPDSRIAARERRRAGER